MSISTTTYSTQNFWKKMRELTPEEMLELLERLTRVRWSDSGEMVDIADQVYMDITGWGINNE